MKAVVQRVTQASVLINNQLHAQIGNGLLVLLGVQTDDTIENVTRLSKKIVQMRIFSDQDGKMNLSVNDISGDILLVSQFTLIADTTKGNRPSFINAARPETAIPLYEAMIQQLSRLIGKPIQTGVFGADMQISLHNDGPVTIVMEN